MMTDTIINELCKKNIYDNDKKDGYCSMILRIGLNKKMAKLLKAKAKEIREDKLKEFETNIFE